MYFHVLYDIYCSLFCQNENAMAGRGYGRNDRRTNGRNDRRTNWGNDRSGEWGFENDEKASRTRWPCFICAVNCFSLTRAVIIALDSLLFSSRPIRRLSSTSDCAAEIWNDAEWMIRRERCCLSVATCSNKAGWILLQESYDKNHTGGMDTVWLCMNDAVGMIQ